MSAFRKSRPDATRADFEMEAAGLRWIGEADGIRVPEVLGVGGDPGWIEMERIGSGNLSDAGAEDLGRALAGMHALGSPSSGSLPPGAPDQTLRIGLADVELEESSDWPSVYTERQTPEGSNPPTQHWSSRSASGSRIWPVRRSRPPASTATCGAGT